MSIGDGVRSIFLSTKGENWEEVSEELVKFLDFVRKDTAEDTQESEDAFVRKLQHSMQRIKQNREMEHQYMLLEDLLKEERKLAEIKVAQGFIMDVLQHKGNVSEELHERIMSQTKMDILKRLHTMAVQAKTLEEFEELISNL